MSLPGWTGPTVLAAIATALGLIAASPSVTAAQEASIQARVTVLAPQEQPSVRVVAPGPESAAAAVVVAGAPTWGVRVQVGEEEFVMSHRPTAAGRIELSPGAWASAIRPSQAERSRVRVILATN